MLIYQQRNKCVWICEFLGIVMMMCRHFHVFSLGDVWEFVMYFHHLAAVACNVH
jgi:hypothetical protein